MEVLGPKCNGCSGTLTGEHLLLHLRWRGRFFLPASPSPLLGSALRAGTGPLEGGSGKLAGGLCGKVKAVGQGPGPFESFAFSIGARVF